MEGVTRLRTNIKPHSVGSQHHGRIVIRVVVKLAAGPIKGKAGPAIGFDGVGIGAKLVVVDRFVVTGAVEL